MIEGDATNETANLDPQGTHATAPPQFRTGESGLKSSKKDEFGVDTDSSVDSDEISGLFVNDFTDCEERADAGVLGELLDCLRQNSIAILYGRIGLSHFHDLEPGHNADWHREIPNRLNAAWAAWETVGRESRIKGVDKLRGRFQEFEIAWGRRQPAEDATRERPGLLIAPCSVSSWNTNAFRELFSAAQLPKTKETLEASNWKLVVMLYVEPEHVEPEAVRESPVAVKLPWEPALALALMRDRFDADARSRVADEIKTRLEQMPTSARGRICDRLLSDRSLLQFNLIKNFESALWEKIERAWEAIQIESAAGAPLDAYDVQDAFAETSIVVSTFVPGLKRDDFDRLCGALLPDGDAPNQYLPSALQTVQQVAAQAPHVSASWGYTGHVAPSVEPVKRYAWTAVWDEWADYYRDRLSLPIRNGRVGVSVRSGSAEMLLAKRARRLELIADRILSRGLPFEHDPHSASGAGMRLFVELHHRLGLVDTDNRLAEILTKIIETAEQPDFKTDISRVLTDYITELSKIPSSDYGERVRKALGIVSQRCIRSSVRARALTNICMRLAASESDPDTQLLDVLRASIHQANSETRPSIVNAAQIEFERLLRGGEQKLQKLFSFLDVFSQWLPSAPIRDEPHPPEQLALSIVDQALNYEISWGEPRLYAERRSAAMFAQIAFSNSPDAVILARCLTRLRMCDIAAYDEWPGWRRPDRLRARLHDRIIDVFHVTIDGVGRPDSALIDFWGLSHVFANCVINRVQLGVSRAAPDSKRPGELIESSADRNEAGEDLQELISLLAALAQQGEEGLPESEIEKDRLRGLAVGYFDARACSHYPSEQGELARRYLTTLDLFSAAVLANWFFCCFGLRPEPLKPDERARVDSFLAHIATADTEDFLVRASSSLDFLADIIREYVPLLVKQKVRQASLDILALKQKKLRALARACATARITG